MGNKTQITISLEPDVLEEVESAAKALHMSRSGFCAMLIGTTVQGDYRGFFGQVGTALRESLAHGEKADKKAPPIPNSAPV